MSLKRAATAALLLGSLPSPAPSAPITPQGARSVVWAKPALWEVRDQDTTIYLFGTFHSLDARTVWFDDEVRRAFNRSNELMLETVVPADMGGARSMVNVDGKPRAYFAQSRMAAGLNRSLGLTTDNGADAVLRRVADNLGKPVGGLEAFEEQLGQLSRIPAAAPQPGFGNLAPRPVIGVTDLLAAWTSGNTGAFSTMLSGFEARSPAAYRLLIADRNARWGQWIATRLQSPGTVFVAVGSGHLAGKDSVQTWLASRGITATRIG